MINLNLTNHEALVVITAMLRVEGETARNIAVLASTQLRNSLQKEMDKLTLTRNNLTAADGSEDEGFKFSFSG